MENKTPKDDLVVTSFVTKSRDQRLALPTSSSKLIVYPDGSSKAKATGRALIASFWEDAGIAVQKAHDVISVEDVEPLKGKPPFKLMLSHLLVSFPYIFALAGNAKKDKDHSKTLDKCIDTEKAFSKLKNKKMTRPS
nr:hypothetical protein CFP56_35543 [Quercus suber]